MSGSTINPQDKAAFENLVAEGQFIIETGRAQSEQNREINKRNEEASIEQDQQKHDNKVFAERKEDANAQREEVVAPIVGQSAANQIEIAKQNQETLEKLDRVAIGDGDTNTNTNANANPLANSSNITNLHTQNPNRADNEGRNENEKDVFDKDNKPTTNVTNTIVALKHSI